MKNFLSSAIILLFPIFSFAQPVQTIHGIVTDAGSKIPVIRGNVIVSSEKEVLLNEMMNESVKEKNEGLTTFKLYQTRNEIAAVSSRPFTIEKTEGNASSKKNYWLITSNRSDTIVSSHLDRIIDNTLFYSGIVSGNIAVDSIASITHVRFPHYAKTIGIGLGAGALVGLIVGLIAAPEEDASFFADVSIYLSALMGTAIGIGVGTGTGIAISQANRTSKHYNLSHLELEQKKKIIAKYCVTKDY